MLQVNMLFSNTFSENWKHFLTGNLNSKRQAQIRQEQEVWASVPKCHVCQNGESGSRRRRRVSWGSGQTCLQSEITANVKEKTSTVAPHHKRKAQQPNRCDHRHMAGAGCQAARRQSVTDGAVVSPPWCVLLWIWVALGWLPAALNVFILFRVIILLCCALMLQVSCATGPNFMASLITSFSHLVFRFGMKSNMTNQT